MRILRVSREDKEKKLNQKGQVIWFTGLPSSGKTTLAIALERYLFENSKTAIILDGDELRKGLNSDLNFTENDRLENIRRIAETAKVLKNTGCIVIVSVISPQDNLRELAKSIIGQADFSLVYVEASLEECEKRDVKGLYKKARNGEIKDFTGINSSFEIPQEFELILQTQKKSINDCLNELKKLI